MTTTTNTNLSAPESIHTLSAMGEALEEWFNTYESEDERLEKDYPMDWIEEVCECNHWQLCEGSQWHDEDICTDGHEYLYMSEGRDGECVCAVSDSLPSHTTKLYLLDVMDIDEFATWFNEVKPMILDDAEVGHDKYDGPYLLVHDEGIARVAEAAREFLKNNKIRYYVED
jgi:hypothetical protein